MKKRWMRLLYFVVPFLIVVVLGTAAGVYLQRDDIFGIHGEPVEVEYNDLDISLQNVRVSGMAHYPITVKQEVPGNAFFDGKTYYLFALFEAHDTASRNIRVLVRTARRPESMVSYEYMTLEGRLRMPTPETVPFELEIQFGKNTDYFFTDDLMVLEPWRIEVDEEVWTVEGEGD
ncbi:MAG: hypothetical protein HN348_18690 [Proteobacteria bacterium]|nr:hypothetical protein [Pseudomonadota bacterium]